MPWLSTCIKATRSVLAFAIAAILQATTAPALAQSLEVAIMPGPVIQGHAKYETACKNCHVRMDRNAQRRLCLDCHKPVAADVAAGTGFHGRIKERDCRTCHTEHKGRGAKIVVVDEATFDHRQTDFALHGTHERTKCASCHVAGRKFAQAAHACNGCHAKDDKHKAALGLKCEDCHAESKWKETRFDHNRTKFQLKSKHADAKCRDCHGDQRFKDTPKECYSCHKKDDERKDGEKRGHHGRFGEKCQTCHNETGWKPSLFSHERDAKYPLRGKHEAAKCMSCHTGNLYHDKLAKACVSCHLKDDAHKTALGPKCESCHNESTWKKAQFDHDKSERFPLRDKHRTARCESCHIDKTFKQKLQVACYACHRKNDDEKGHHGRFGEKCQSCHNAKGWKPASFSHDRDTKYLLRGKHVAARCDGCHKNDLYRDKLDTACLTCHERDDKHEGTLDKRCETCHAETGWKRTSFDHQRSRFPLLDRHARVECKDCHATRRYRDAKPECIACHARDDDKLHKRRYGALCQNCHDARTWKGSRFDHDRSRFKLTGRHLRVACNACHAEAMKEKVVLPLDCASCHVKKDDVHFGTLGRDCARCHVPDDWRKIIKAAGSGPGAPQ